ncbi:MAG: Transposase [Daejeonella sp.]|nr:Transposase [Daejeonella sp.]
MEEKPIKSHQHYSESFKRKVCEEYLLTGHSKMSLLKKYDIRMKSGIQKWLRQLGYEDIHQKARYLNLPLSSLAKKKTATSTSADLLEKRIKELERLLEDEQLRSEAYSRIIDIAEKEFHIPIRKKPNTK